MTVVAAPARVDVGALAASMTNEAFGRISSALTSALVGLNDAENGVNELQQAALFEHLLCAFDGFGRSVASELVTTLRENGVDTWGLPTEFEDLVSDAG